MKIKHKLASRPSWSRIIEKDYKCTYVDIPEFKGYVTELRLLKVKKPLYVFMHRNKLKVADDGYVWYMLFPDDEHYSLTAMADNEGNFVQFYFDIVFKNELNEDGIPGFDDLFLDVVFTKNDSILLDEEDLSAALREGLVDPDTADLAYFTAMRILNQTEGHYDDLCQWISKCISYLD